MDDRVRSSGADSGKPSVKERLCNELHEYAIAADQFRHIEGEGAPGNLPRGTHSGKPD